MCRAEVSVNSVGSLLVAAGQWQQRDRGVWATVQFAFFRRSANRRTAACRYCCSAARAWQCHHTWQQPPILRPALLLLLESAGPAGIRLIPGADLGIAEPQSDTEHRACLFVYFHCSECLEAMVQCPTNTQCYGKYLAFLTALRLNHLISLNKAAKVLNTP